jgi:hypothetical protein
MASHFDRDSLTIIFAKKWFETWFKSIIGILHVDGYWLGLPVPPVVANCAPPSLQFLNARLGNIGLAVERTNCGFIAEDAKICLDSHFSFRL